MTLDSLLSGLTPSVGEVAGHSVVMHYGDAAAEYAALRHGSVVVDRGARGRLRVNGAPGPEQITGLVTNDVTALAAGQGCYAAALTPKGRIIADVRIFRRDDHLLIDVPPRAAAGWLGAVRKYINPRLAPYRDVSADTADVGVFGREARRVVAEVTGVPAERLAELAPYAQMEADGDGVLIVRAPDIELEGYELIAPATQRESLHRRAVAAGATPAGLVAFETARVEAGRPEWGIDIDDATIPQEANLDELHAISYTKGCYIGQEVVARIHFRGHVNRHLRGLRFPAGELPPTGATLLDDSGRPVGDVRTRVFSPRLGSIALGMVRREIEPGRSVRVAWEEGEAAADVGRLPFSA